MARDTLKHKEARTGAPNRKNSIGRVDNMDIEENPLPNIAVSTNVFKQHFLYAFSSPGEIQNYIRTQAHEDENKRLPEIVKNWQTVQPQVLRVLQTEAGLAETIGVKPIPDEYQAQLSEFAKDPLFEQTFSSLPMSFQLVEADKLIFPQRIVNLDYVRELREAVSQPPSFAELLDMCVSPNRPIAPIQHLELFPNPVHVFSSPNTDLRNLGSRMKHLTPDDLKYAQGGQPAAAIITFVGYGVASINAYHVGKRFILGIGHIIDNPLSSLVFLLFPIQFKKLSTPTPTLPKHL